jgi:hypothetical protein
LLRATVGDQKIALTTERSVVEYFACNAVSADKHDHPDAESSPVVLVLDGEGLLALCTGTSGWSARSATCKAPVTIRSRRRRNIAMRDAWPSVWISTFNYNLVPFSDPYWGEGGCAWENEIECWDDIEPLEEVLIRVEPAPTERYQVLIERGCAAFKPATPPIAGFELTVMADAIGKLVEDEITPADADGVVSALAALRSALQPSRARSASSVT